MSLLLLLLLDSLLPLNSTAFLILSVFLIIEILISHNSIDFFYTINVWYYNILVLHTVETSLSGYEVMKQTDVQRDTHKFAD